MEISTLIIIALFLICVFIRIVFNHISVGHIRWISIIGIFAVILWMGTIFYAIFQDYSRLINQDLWVIFKYILFGFMLLIIHKMEFLDLFLNGVYSPKTVKKAINENIEEADREYEEELKAFNLENPTNLSDNENPSLARLLFSIGKLVFLIASMGVVIYNIITLIKQLLSV